MSTLDESLKELLDKEPHEFETVEDLMAAVKRIRASRAAIGRDRELKAAGAQTLTSKGAKKANPSKGESLQSISNMVAALKKKQELEAAGAAESESEEDESDS